MVDLPCPTCGSPLTFLEQYQRNYCLRCGQYAPEGYGDRGAKRCSTCGGILSFIVQYNRFYCYRCNTYAQDEPAAPAKPEPTASTPAPESARSPAAATGTNAASIPPSEPTPAPAAAPTTLVAAAPPTPATLVAQPTPESAAPPAAQPEPKPTNLEASPAPTPAPVAPEKPAEPVPQEPSKEIQTLAASKPAIVRVKIFALKKSELIDLCKAYDLDPSGTKEQVQERLLSYLHDLEAEEPPDAEEEIPAETATPTVEPSPAPAQASEPVAEPPRESSVATAAPAAAVVVQMEKPEPGLASTETVSEPAPTVVEVPRLPLKNEHPCSTCGRELAFIAQYDRYYCYYCQRYAPAARAKGACPTCGATMRWVDQYQRWWCDSCLKYAPADLPRPAATVATRPVVATVPAQTSRPAILLHHHASPATGMGLVGVGLALWVIYEFYAVLAPAMNLAIGNPFTDSLGAVMIFFAFLFVGAGALVGLSSLRDRL